METTTVLSSHSRNLFGDRSCMTLIISNGLDVILHVATLVMVTRIGMAYSQNIVEPTGATYGGHCRFPPPLT
jgi:hypothetical protein